jgi:hypothetical protein
LLCYNNKAAAAVDFIMFKFDNFSIINFVLTGFIKESSHVWSKKDKLSFWNIFVMKNLNLFFGKKTNVNFL